MLRNLLIVDEPTSSLKQGAAFNKKIKSYRREREGFTSGFEQLKSEFDQTLAQYSAAYNQYVADFIKHQESPTSKYTNSLVTALTGEKYMINKFGYLRKFATNASCTTGNNIVLDASTISQVPVGANLAEKEVCGLEGQMIQNTQTKQIAWVDEKGIRHMKDDATPIPQGCPTNLVGVPSDGFSAMTAGDNLSQSSTCNTSALNDDLHPTLVALNDKLIDLSTKMLSESSKMRGSYSDYDKVSQNADTIIKGQLAELKKQKQKLKSIINQTATIEATMFDNSAIVSSNSLKYLLIAGGTAVAIGYLLFGGSGSGSVEHH
jgi:hypothetical protein